MTPEPWWPVVALAIIQAVDAGLCVGPVPFVRGCLEDVGFPRRLWVLLPWVKGLAAVGLVGGLVIPYLAFITSLALVAYFLIAITMHIRARDFGSNLAVNATSMLIICAGVCLWCTV
ncbi:DoxX family protein [Nocardioides lijunqiniae]|uniref:DoxX family protein n=1 Tax=Nocardioides lijunqiniae TaxID=2760832 RepID=UPI001877D449